MTSTNQTFRYLNDKATRGGINDTAGANAIRGVIIPAGDFYCL
jgi:hypothetical protein